MALNDPQHLKASAQALRLLDRYGISRPGEIHLEDIAWDLGIEIVTGPLRGAEAHLVRVGEVGAITLSELLVEQPNRRFAIGHELGHWQLHRSISQLFYCTDSDMREYRNSGPELEANTFASELLMPKFMFNPKLLTTEPNWGAIQEISAQFSVTKLSAAVRYADLAHHPVMAVFSDGTNVHWWRENRTRMDGLWLESKQSICEDCIAFHEAREGGAGMEMQQVPWEAWFPHIPAFEDDELWEFSARLDDKGTMLSLLWAPSRC
jgi:hypothetical protein